MQPLALLLQRSRHHLLLSIMALAISASAAESAPERTLIDDGNWEYMRTSVIYHSAIYDPVRNRMLIFGSYYTSDVWELTLSGTPTWTKLSPGGTVPSPRPFHSAIYDPVRDRMLVFGGRYADTISEVYALSLSGAPTWTLLSPTGTAPARTGHTAIYDPVRDRMLVFGGSDGSNYQNDVYELTLAGTPAWALINPPDPKPEARIDHTAIYDPVGDRMIVYGGYGSSGSFNDVWSFELSGAPTWVMLTPSGTPPPQRSNHTAIYDPGNGRMIVFGGDGTSDTWELSLNSLSWSQLAPSGAAPSPRYGHTAVYDSQGGRMLVYGGAADTYTFGLELSGSPAWAHVDGGTAFPRPHSEHTAVYDAVDQRMVVFGGQDYESSINETILNETWALSLAGEPIWTQLSPAGPLPTARRGHSAIIDQDDHRMIVFGGIEGNGTFRNDVWELTLTGTPTWSQLNPAGTPPVPRWQHRAVYDPSRDRMLVFGGFDGSNYRNDVWALSLSGSPTWTLLPVSGTPPSGRSGFVMIHDPVRDRILVFGGCGNCQNDLWQLSLASVPTWSQLSVPGEPPFIGFYSVLAGIYESRRDRMVVSDGSRTYSLALTGTPQWTTLAPYGPGGRRLHSLIYDRIGDRMVLYGGQIGHLNPRSIGDIGFLQWNSPVPVPEQLLVDRFAIRLAGANPARGQARFELAMVKREAVEVNIYDVRGALVRRLAQREFDPGRHPLTWDGTDADGRQSRAGIYFMRAVSREGKLNLRMALVR